MRVLLALALLLSLTVSKAQQSTLGAITAITGTNTILELTNLDNSTFLSVTRGLESGNTFSNLNRYAWQDTYRRIAARQNITIMRSGDGLGGYGAGMLQHAARWFNTNHSTFAGTWLPIFPEWYAASGSGTHYQVANQNGMVLCNADALLTTSDTVVYSNVSGNGNSLPANVFAVWYITAPGFGHFKVETNLNGGAYTTVSGYANVSSATTPISSAILWWTNVNGAAATTVRITANDANATNIIVSVSALNTTLTNGFYILPWVGSSSCTWSNIVCSNQNTIAPFFQAADPALILDEHITWDQEVNGAGSSSTWYDTWLDFVRTNNPKANYVECSIYPTDPDTAILANNFRMFTNCYGRSLSFFDGHTPFLSYSNMTLRGWQNGDGTHASDAGFIAYDTILYHWLDVWNSQMLMPYSASPPYARVTGSDATTTGQSLVDVTGLSVVLAAGTAYDFEAVLGVTTTAVTTGTKYGVQFSTAGATVEAQLLGSLTSASSQSERISALNTATAAYLTTSAQSGQVLIKGIIITGINSGNLTIQHLKVTSGTSTVKVNSYLKATKL